MRRLCPSSPTQESFTLPTHTRSCLHLLWSWSLVQGSFRWMLLLQSSGRIGLDNGGFRAFGPRRGTDDFCHSPGDTELYYGLIRRYELSVYRIALTHGEQIG